MTVSLFLCSLLSHFVHTEMERQPRDVKFQCIIYFRLSSAEKKQLVNDMETKR